MIKFIIPGQPVGKQRARTVRQGNSVHSYTPQKTVDYEQLVAAAYREQSPIIHEGSISLTVLAYFPIPKSASQKNIELMRCGVIRPAKKPDADNILKIIADGLNGVAFRDDSQIVSARIEKYYSMRPRIEVEIE